MKWLRGVIAAAVLTMVAVPMVGQTLTVTDVGDRIVYGGVYVGPYGGSMPGFPDLDIFCVDFSHHAYLNAPWNVTVRSLGENPNLTGTRYGPSALGQYRTATWLASQFSGTPTGHQNAGWGSLHAAIWNLFTPEPNWSFPDEYEGNLPSEWIGEAQQAVNPGNASAFNDWYVITDNSGVHQEFIARVNVVPEPATLILMGTGLIAVAGMTVVMRQSVG